MPKHFLLSFSFASIFVREGAFDVRTYHLLAMAARPTHIPSDCWRWRAGALLHITRTPLSSHLLPICTYCTFTRTLSSMMGTPAAKATVASRLVAAVITTTCIMSYASAFQSPASQLRVPTAAAPHTYRARSTSLANVSDGEGPSRRTVLGAGLFGGIFGNGSSGAANAAA